MILEFNEKAFYLFILDNNSFCKLIKHKYYISL